MFCAGGETTDPLYAHAADLELDLVCTASPVVFILMVVEVFPDRAFEYVASQIDQPVIWPTKQLFIAMR